MIFDRDVKFFGKNTFIKYMTAWDRDFGSFCSGSLLFYKGNPQYIVEVTVLSDINNIRPDDIFISLGEHNSLVVEDMLNKAYPILLNLCKNQIESQFVLDVNKMKILGYDDFTENFPIHGLNTFFVMEDTDKQYFNARCLVNASRNSFSDEEFFSWFLSYINSLNVCMPPIDTIKTFPKLFLQAISCLISNVDVVVSNSPPIMNCAISDNGEVFMEFEPSTERFKILVNKSREQMIKDRKKKERCL